MIASAHRLWERRRRELHRSSAMPQQLNSFGNAARYWKRAQRAGKVQTHVGYAYHGRVSVHWWVDGNLPRPWPRRPPPDLAHAEDGSAVIFNARGTAAWSENKRAAWRASKLVWRVNASPNLRSENGKSLDRGNRIPLSASKFVGAVFSLIFGVSFWHKIEAKNQCFFCVLNTP